jgi:hypothetical protein
MCSIIPGIKNLVAPLGNLKTFHLSLTFNTHTQINNKPTLIMPSDEWLQINSTTVYDKNKTIHNILKNISHLIWKEFLTNTHSHTSTGSLGYSIQFTQLWWTDSWQWDIADTDIAKYSAEGMKILMMTTVFSILLCSLHASATFCVVQFSN